MTVTTVIAVVVLLLCTWPLVRLVSIPSLRAQYPRVVVIAVTVILFWALLVTVAAYLQPDLLAPAAIVAAGLLLLERWRARASYGVSRGLPPGSLSLVPRAPWVDDSFYADQAKRHGPVFKMSQFFRPMVCLMGPGEGVDLLEGHASDLYSPPVRFNRFIPKGYIRYMSPTDHTIYKSVIRNALNGKVLSDCSGSFRRLINASLATIERQARSSGGVHPESEISRMTFRSMLRLFIGLDEDSVDVDEWLARYRKVEIGKAASRWRSEDRDAANAIADIILQRAKDPDALPSCVLREICSQSDARTVDMTIALNLVYMMRISAMDLAGFLTWSIKLLADNPAWYERLQTAVRTESNGGAEELAALMVREILRLERSEFIFRKARRTFEYKGFKIPKDWIVRVCIRDGHRDPAVFNDPEVFDPLRFKARSFTKREYSPLGIGPHACAGGTTIQAVGRLFLIELVKGWSMSVADDGPREYGRAHWQPNSRFRIALHPMASPERA